MENINSHHINSCGGKEYLHLLSKSSCLVAVLKGATHTATAYVYLRFCDWYMYKAFRSTTKMIAMTTCTCTPSSLHQRKIENIKKIEEDTFI